MNFSRVCGGIVLASAFLARLAMAQQGALAPPQPRGKLVDLGGHRLHVDCRGAGSPTVIVENGFEEFSFDWSLVQSRVAKFNRICTYDRAGYAWSDPGPAPRTLVQINLELHDALAKLGEQGPFVLVGHSFGGPIARSFAMVYAKDVAGVVFVDAVSEDQRFEMWNKAVLMRDGAKGKADPVPHEDILPGDKLADSPYFNAAKVQKIESPFDRLAPDLQVLHLWAQSQRSLAATEENERTWSPEYFARWHDHPAPNPLGSIPLIVLTRKDGGFRDLDILAVQQEAERKTNQARLVGLSKRGSQRIIIGGEDMELESPDAVVQAILDVVKAADKDSAAKPKQH